jgi:hypothetical protein
MWPLLVSALRLPVAALALAAHALGAFACPGVVCDVVNLARLVVFGGRCVR